MELAVDIIFTLPENINQKAIGISRKIQTFSEDKIHMSDEKNIPHISLWMGIIPVSKLDELHQKISFLHREMPFPEIRVLQISGIDSDSKRILSFQIEKNNLLLKWHNQVSQIANQYSVTKLAQSSHFAEENIQANTLHYLKQFQKEHSGQNYDPHITLGFAKVLEKSAAFSFKPKAIASYQLANYCTCHTLIKNISSEQSPQ